MRRTAAVLAGAARTLDLDRPAAILLLAVLHFLPDADDPAGMLELREDARVRTRVD